MLFKRYSLTKRILSPLLPYLCVGIGLLVFSNAWAAMLSYHFGMFLILLLVNELPSFQAIRKSGNNRIVISLFFIGGIAGLLLYLVWPVLSVPGNINLKLQNIGLTSSAWPYFIVWFILVNAILEEFYWRSYLSSSVKRFTVNDFLFSGYHVLVLAGKVHPVWLVVVFILLVVAAWFWRQANIRNGSILASVISHIAADTSVILAIYFLTSGI